MIVLKSEQIMRAESEYGAWSTELHECYRRLLLNKAYNLYGPSLQGADYEMGRDDQIPSETMYDIVTTVHGWTQR